MNIKMYYYRINFWDIQWLEFKVKIIEEDLLKSTKFHCLSLMTNYILKVMDMVDYVLVIRVSYKKTVILITI